MTRYAVLLRAINVGGHNKIPMAELRAALSDAGLADVTTYIQSGNIACASRRKSAGVATLVASVIADTFGHAIGVLVRTAEEMQSIGDVFPHTDHNPKACGVVFMNGHVDGPLDAAKFAPDECAVDGSEVFMRWADGVSGSKLTPAWVEKQTGLVGTHRNWATVQKLLEMVEA